MLEWRIHNVYEKGKNILDYLLSKKGLSTENDFSEFLNPPLVSDLINKLPTEFLESLDAASKTINEAISSGVPIVVHGDYDADGICATAILYNALKTELNYSKTFYFIPNRFDHGYGLSKESILNAIDYISASLNEKPAEILFITVDSGITAVAEVEFINSLGHGVIITDHHQKPSILPGADCIVWYDQIVGSTIAWLLTQKLGSTDIKNMGLAAIATVTDLQPLMNFNRALVKQGLQILNTNPYSGIKKLVSVAGKAKDELTTYDLGWVIGPRLNASGRLVEATDAVKLLTETDEALLDQLAANLNNINVLRQDKTLEMFELAQNDNSQEIPKIIFSQNPEYHEGIIGLVAARLVQKYYRPTIVISIKDGMGKGSVRSITGVDIIAMLRNFDDLFVSLGGHPMAAGFSIKQENISVLQEKLLMLAEEAITPEHLQRILEIDLQIPIELSNVETLSILDKLKPYGVGNSEPVFMSANLGVAGINFVGRESQHLSIKLFEGGKFYKAIFFDGKEKIDLNIGDKVDVAFTLKGNEYNGNKYVDLVVKDMKKST